MIFLEKSLYPWPSEIKKTRQRQCVLDVLAAADRPLSAMEICKRTEDADSPVWLSTVYRILELFEGKNVVVRTTLSDGEMALYELNRHQHRHYAVCLGCHKVVELEHCPLQNFTPELGDSGFQVTGHRLEMYGYCKDCAKKMK